MIREILDIYNRNWNQILIWSTIIILPITTFTFFSMIFLNVSEDILAPHYFMGFIFILNFILCIPPFFKMVIIDQQDEVIKSIDGIFFFVKQFGLYFLITGVFYFIAYLGMYLLFIPTLFALFFLLVFPFFSENRSLKEIFTQTVQAIVKENFALIGDLIIILSINLGIWLGMMLFFGQYENNIFAYLIIRIVLNILVFPFIYIYLTLRFRRSNELVN